MSGHGPIGTGGSLSLRPRDRLFSSIRLRAGELQALAKKRASARTQEWVSGMEAGGNAGLPHPSARAAQTHLPTWGNRETVTRTLRSRAGMPSAPMIFITPRGKERPSRRRRPQLGQDVRSGAPYAARRLSRPTAVARSLIAIRHYCSHRPACGDLDLLAAGGTAGFQVRSYLRSALVAELPRKKRVSPRPDGIVGQLLDGRATPGPRGVERKLLSRRAQKVVGGNHLQQQSAKNRTAFRARDEVRQEDLIPIVPVLGRTCETPRGRWRKKGRRRGQRVLKPLLGPRN